MKYVIHSVSPTPQPFLFTFPFLTAAPICFLGGPVSIDMFVCMVLAWTIIFDTFWQCGIESICLAKSCDPNTHKTKAKIPQTRAKTVKRAQILISGHLGQFESFCKRCIFDRVWRNMNSIALMPILSVWIYQLSSRACNPGLNRNYYGLMVSLWGNHDDHNLFFQKSPCFHFMTPNRCVFFWNASLP